MQDIRKSSEYQRWRGDVRRRDGNACRVCGVQRNIHVHHIKPFKKYPDFATDIDNGITLCGNCHTLFRGKEESTNLQTITEAVTGQPDLRTTNQLKRLNGKFCTYLDSLLKSNGRFTRNKAVHQLFAHLQIYPDSLDQFLPLIRYLLDKSHLLDKENSGFNQGLIVQGAVEYLKGSSSSAALKVLREHEERIEAEAEERSELFPRARQGDAEAQFRLGEMWATGKGGGRSRSAAFKHYRDAAQQGHVEAQFRVGNMYQYGRDVSDEDEAFQWYQKAAEQGHAEAQYTLGQMCEDDSRDQEAFQWYHQAAKQGHAEAQYRLGQIYEDSEENSGPRYFIEYSPVDKVEALYWYIEAAEQGHAEAQYKLGEMYENIEVDEDDEDIEVCLRDYSEAEDYKVEATKWFRKAAEQGHTEAQYKLGKMYEDGRGVEQDSKKAIEWYQKAADRGLYGALYTLGKMYEDGSGVEQDSRKAIEWYRKAAQQRHTTAQYKLGEIYEYGKGVEQNDEEAVKWYRKAAKQRSAKNWQKLSEMYDAGRGIGPDDEEAFKWYSYIVKFGSAVDQLLLGIMYANGRGIPQDDEEAVKWYRKAAKHYYSPTDRKAIQQAQYRLGEMYEEGRGVPQDDAEAVKWYQETAQQGYANHQKGYPKAQYKLGVMYANGRGVAQNNEATIEWFRKAARQGDTAAQNELARRGETFTDEQISLFGNP